MYNNDNMTRKFGAVCTVLLFALGAQVGWSQSVGLGTPISEDLLRSFDQIVEPDGIGLPDGSGTPLQGKLVFETRCQACHGATGEGTIANTTLVGGNMQSESAPVQTVGSYWPYATTLFDYVRRAMPADSPKSLSDTEVYQVVAYVLYLNGIINQYAVLNKESLLTIQMPNKDGFIDQSHLQ